jgi:hypothetical protein
MPADSYLAYWLADDVLSSAELRYAQEAVGVPAACAVARSHFVSAFEALRPDWRRLYGRVRGTAIDAEPLKPNVAFTQEQRKLLLALGLAGADLVMKRSEGVKRALMQQTLSVEEDTIDYASREREIAAAGSKDASLCGLIEAVMESR